MRRERRPWLTYVSIRSERIAATIDRETVHREVVADRDDWTCGLCSQAIPRVVLYPHPLSLSVDHVAPLALGGGHTYSNVRASHLRCNIAQGNAIRAARLALTA